MERLWLLLAVAVLAGCATPVSELRNMPADRTVTVAAPIERVAPCIARHFGDLSSRAGGAASYVMDPTTRSAEIVANNTAEPMVLAQLTSPAGDQTKVDLRLGVRYVVSNALMDRAEVIARGCLS